ncbi:MAG: hypothetical protein QOG62_1666 [Thermoleophilaceae bacterium]|nr:hypothetical protein [Thermoleophilaceae bacterium]
MLLRLLITIWAFVLTLLGVTFLIVGSVVGGQVQVFVPLGGALSAGALVLWVVAGVLWSRVRAERQRRREGRRVEAEVVEARLHQMTRVGVMLTYTLTVRFSPQGVREETVTRTVLVPPTLALEPGSKIEIQYDPADPANFEPIGAAH